MSLNSRLVAFLAFFPFLLIFSASFSALFSAPAAACWIAAISIFVNLILLVFRVGAFHPATLVILTAFPYLLASPIDLFLLGGSSFIQFNPILVAWMLVAGSAFSYCYTLGVIFGGKKFLPQLSVTQKLNPRVIVAVLIFAAAAYAASVFILFSFDVGRLSRGEIYGQKPVAFDVFKLFIYPLIMVCMWYLMVVRRERFRALILPVFSVLAIFSIDLLVLGDRRAAIMVAMALVYFYSLNNTVRLMHWVVLLGSVIFLWLLGVVRNTPIGEWLSVLSSVDFSVIMNPSNVEFGAFSLVWQDVLSSSNFSLDLSYLKAFIQIIPAAIFPDRPPPPSVWFVGEYYPEVAAKGGGLAFNALLESVMNFHFLGPVIAGFVVGRIFSKVGMEPSEIGALFGGLLILTLAFFMRNDFVTILRGLIVCGLISYIAVLGFCHVRVNKKMVT